MAKCVQELHPRVVFSPKGGALALGHARPVVACNPPCTIRNAARWEYWGERTPAQRAQPSRRPPRPLHRLRNSSTIGEVSGPEGTRDIATVTVSVYIRQWDARARRPVARLSLLPRRADIRPEVPGTWLVKPC